MYTDVPVSNLQFPFLFTSLFLDPPDKLRVVHLLVCDPADASGVHPLDQSLDVGVDRVLERGGERAARDGEHVVTARHHGLKENKKSIS